MDRKTIRTAGAPAAIGPYSQGVSLGNLVFCSGQIPLDPRNGTLVSGDVREEVRRVVENLRYVLEAAQSGLERVVRLDVYLTDLALFGEVNVSLEEVFSENPPARVTVGVSSLPMGARIEMAAVAER